MACGGGEWEFDCPQFVDFEASLNNIPDSDSWLEGFNANKKTDHVSSKSLGPKFLSTPKFKPIKLLKNSPFVNTERSVQTDDQKLCRLNNLKRLSKSDNFLNLIGKKNLKEKKVQNYQNPSKGHLRRKSLSENCLKTKKNICPRTPMCLKRTLNKPKSKKKTTEEIELEKISELQNKLSKQLKLNEVNFRRIKNNENPYQMDDLHKIKSSKVPVTSKQLIKGSEVLSNRLNEIRENRRTRFQHEHSQKIPIHRDKNPVFDLNKAEKLRNVVNSVRAAYAGPSSNALRVLNKDNKQESEQHPDKTPKQKLNAHSGLKFFPNNKLTLPEPFSFDSSCSSVSNSSFRFRDTKAHLSSIRIQNLTRDKENLCSTSRYLFSQKR